MKVSNVKTVAVTQDGAHLIEGADENGRVVFPEPINMRNGDYLTVTAIVGVAEGGEE